MNEKPTEKQIKYVKLLYAKKDFSETEGAYQIKKAVEEFLKTGKGGRQTVGELISSMVLLPDDVWAGANVPDGRYDDYDDCDGDDIREEACRDMMEGLFQ